MVSKARAGCLLAAAAALASVAADESNAAAEGALHRRRDSGPFPPPPPLEPWKPLDLKFPESPKFPKIPKFPKFPDSFPDRLNVFDISDFPALTNIPGVTDASFSSVWDKTHVTCSKGRCSVWSSTGHSFHVFTGKGGPASPTAAPDVEATPTFGPSAGLGLKTPPAATPPGGTPSETAPIVVPPSSGSSETASIVVPPSSKAVDTGTASRASPARGPDDEPPRHTRTATDGPGAASPAQTGSPPSVQLSHPSKPIASTGTGLRRSTTAPFTPSTFLTRVSSSSAPAGAGHVPAAAAGASASIKFECNLASNTCAFFNAERNAPSVASRDGHFRVVCEGTGHDSCRAEISSPSESNSLVTKVGDGYAYAQCGEACNKKLVGLDGKTAVVECGAACRANLVCKEGETCHFEPCGAHACLQVLDCTGDACLPRPPRQGEAPKPLAIRVEAEASVEAYC